MDHADLAMMGQVDVIRSPCYERTYKSGRHDLNMRPLRPERSALARLSYAPILGLRYRAFCQSRMRASLRCPKAIREKRLF